MEAIYQRARPATFGEVVGQDHVKDVLAAALRTGRTGHAYLFSGPRGVGKTTTARLLAMALNCEAAEPSERPCGRCDACTQIRSARHPDVIELDAASNNSVDDVRELRERVRLASLRGGTRVWILDEAHMLSTAAANALLKTLEEPPTGLVFVLATTEPERLPSTVLSRCQHFRFRRLSVPEIAGKLAVLCERSGVEAEQEALELVARAAEGAMRDAESMLERLWADGGPIVRDAAEAALGLPPRERLEALANALASDDLAPLLAGATELYRDGFSPRTVAEQLARVLRDAVVNEATGQEGYRAPVGRDALLRTLHQFDDELERFVRHDDLYALEAALLKAANAAASRPFQLASSQAVAVAASTEEPTEKPAASDAPRPLPAFEPNARPDDARPDDASHGASASPAASAAAEAPAPATDASPSADSASDTSASDTSGSDSSGSAAASPGPATPRAGRTLSWHQVKTKASPQLKAFLQPAEDEVEGDVLTLRYGERHRFHFGQLKSRQDELAALVGEVAGPGWSLVIEGPDETIRKKA
ncbi:MAG: DNA polymerase III subunit gamma/tau [Trueperaceae bacterium]|nr:DNA polymerase III subunit gamma/tau [Trueperaceae bacterium]